MFALTPYFRRGGISLHWEVMKYQQNTEQKAEERRFHFTSKLKWKFQFVELKLPLPNYPETGLSTKDSLKGSCCGMTRGESSSCGLFKPCSSSVKAKALEAEAACRRRRMTGPADHKGGDRPVLREWVECCESQALPFCPRLNLNRDQEAVKSRRLKYTLLPLFAKVVPPSGITTLH